MRTVLGPADLGLVPLRRLVESPVDAVFALAPGDRPLVEAGESVVVGAPIAERLRDARLEEVSIQASRNCITSNTSEAKGVQAYALQVAESFAKR